MANLTVTQGTNEGSSFELGKRPLTIGREPSRDIQIVDSKVSRKHAQVRLDGEIYVLREFETRNGTFLNGEKVQGEVTLQDGDQIGIGDAVLRFSLANLDDQTNALHKYKQGDRSLREDRTLVD